MRLRYWIAPLAALVLIAAGWFVARSGFTFRRALVALTILAINDFHGNLQAAAGRHKILQSWTRRTRAGGSRSPPAGPSIWQR